MIKNSKQLGVAKKQLQELEEALEQFKIENKDENNAKYRMGLNSFTSLINGYKKEIEEYIELSSGEANIIHSGIIEDLPQVLIKLRIAKKMSQKDLAEIIEIEEQQIQRYEATDYQSASWTRIMEVIDALDIEIEYKDILLKECKIVQLQLPSHLKEDMIEAAENKIKRNHLLAV